MKLIKKQYHLDGRKRGRESRYKLLGSGPGLTMLHAIICRLHEVTLSDQAQVTLQLTVSLFDLASRFLAGPPFLGARKKSRRSELAIGCPENVRFFFVLSTQ